MGRYLIMLTLFVVGCSSGESFVGTWKGCTVTWTCNGVEMGDADGNTVITSTGANGISILQPNDMPSEWDVTGNQASVVAGSGSGDPDSSGVPWDVTFNPGTLTIADNGVMTGGCAGSGSYKTPAACTYNFGCIATKVGN